MVEVGEKIIFVYYLKLSIIFLSPKFLLVIMKSVAVV